MAFTPREIQILNEIYEVVDNSKNRHILVADMVSYYKISESTLTRAYKYLYNKTISQHRLENTMTEAKTMIQNGIQIKNVAKELGYTSSRTFSATFKNYFGVTPSKYLQHCHAE